MAGKHEDVPKKLKSLDVRGSGKWVKLDAEETLRFLTRIVFSEKSKPTDTECVPWLNASNPHVEMDDTDPCEKREKATKLFKEFTDSGKQVTPQVLKDIAKQVNLTTGKWLVFRYPRVINETWKKISTATKDNKLGIAAKVSTAAQVRSCGNSGGRHGGTHVICVYTKDYTDEVDVYSVADKLRKIGIEGTLKYKADIYTILDIYSGNRWGLYPNVYISKKPIT